MRAREGMGSTRRGWANRSQIRDSPGGSRGWSFKEFREFRKGMWYKVDNKGLYCLVTINRSVQHPSVSESIKWIKWISFPADIQGQGGQVGQAD